MDNHSNQSNQNQEMPKQESPQAGNEQNPYWQQPSAGQSGFSQVDPLDKSQFRHSKLGITAFILSILSIAAIVITFVIGASIIVDIASDSELMTELEYYMNNPEIAQDAAFIESKIGGSIMAIMGSFILVIVALVMSFVGVILGIIGLSSKNKKKVFSMLGVIFNGLVLLGTAGLFVFGLIMGAAAI